MDEKRFGLILRELRQARRLSQEELASQAELHRTYVSQLERGQKSPSLKTLQQIADALGVKPSDILLKVEKRSR